VPPANPARRADQAKLARRLNPKALERAWAHDPEILSLVRSMAKGHDTDLMSAHVPVSKLVAALSGALDSEHSWEDADLWVVTVPAMVAARDADTALRVLLSDYAHFTMARKRPDQPCASGGR
jgi:hypothetical protein